MRHLVIVPARNEGPYMGDLLASLLHQSEPPDRIIVVDDGSSDDTGRIVEAVASQQPAVRLLRPSRRESNIMGPAVVRSFTFGYGRGEPERYTYVSKFDADQVFPPNYCATLLDYLDEHPDVGVAGGVRVETIRGKAVRERAAPGHVPGGLKTFRRVALEAIGGLEPVSGWDIIDQVKLRALGWRTAVLATLPVPHRRAHGSRDGHLAGKAHWGRGAWVIGSHPLFVLARGFYRMLEPPYVAGGLAFWGGYLLAALKRVPRLRDPAVVTRLRAEQLQRLRAWNRPPGE